MPLVDVITHGGRGSGPSFSIHPTPAFFFSNPHPPYAAVQEQVPIPRSQGSGETAVPQTTLQCTSRFLTPDQEGSRIPRLRPASWAPSSRVDYQFEDSQGTEPRSPTGSQWGSGDEDLPFGRRTLPFPIPYRFDPRYLGAYTTTNATPISSRDRSPDCVPIANTLLIPTSKIYG